MKKCGDINHTFACFFHLLVCLVFSSFASFSVSSLSFCLVLFFQRNFCFCERRDDRMITVAGQTPPISHSSIERKFSVCSCGRQGKRKGSGNNVYREKVSWYEYWMVICTQVMYWYSGEKELHYHFPVTFVWHFLFLSLFLPTIDTDLLDS